jgi:hypothetical protein
MRIVILKSCFVSETVRYLIGGSCLTPPLGFVSGGGGAGGSFRSLLMRKPPLNSQFAETYHHFFGFGFFTVSTTVVDG